jgi:hypothetical protein
VGDADERDFYGLEAAVEIEIEASELAGAEFIVDADAGVDFFAGVAVGLEAYFGFEEFDLGGVFFCGSGSGWFGEWIGLLGECGMGADCRRKESECNRTGNW